jgi:hypothetical protein
MPSMFDAIDIYLDKRLKDEITWGEIVSVSGNTAVVRVRKTSGTQSAILANNTEAQSGDLCILVRPPGSNYVVLTTYSKFAQGTIQQDQGLSEELFPPNNIITTNLIPNCITIKWDVPPQRSVVFEVQTNTAAQESGATSLVTTRGAYAIILSDVDLYIRVRSINSEFQASAWSSWQLGSPYSTYKISAINRTINETITILSGFSANWSGPLNIGDDGFINIEDGGFLDIL